MEPTLEIQIKGALSIVALALLSGVWFTPLGRKRWLAASVSGLLIVVSLAAYYNFGKFHGRGFDGAARWVHYWEQFHYQLGSKYFPELGYDGLYVASLAAQRERFPGVPEQPRMRDLRFNRLRDTHELKKHIEQVAARFEPDRWSRFVTDNASFLMENPPDYIAQIRSDIGYNPTPAWTFVARLFNGWLPLDPKNLVFLGALDAALLALMFGVVFRTYGGEVVCSCLVLFGLGYLGRFSWVGGAFLRLDWLAGVVIGVCMLKRDRPALAGALFGYATAVRIFPAAFLFGLAVVAAAAWLRGERPTWAPRFAAAFALATVLALIAGSLTGRGPQAWTEFAERIEIYRQSRGRNTVGLENMVLMDSELFERTATHDPGAVKRWYFPIEKARRLKSERWLVLTLAQGLLLLLLAAALTRAPPAKAAVLSMVAVFALAPTAGYYWMVLMAVPLLCSRGAVLVTLAVNAGLYGLHLFEPDTLVLYGLISWVLLALFLALTIPEAVATLRRAIPPRR